MLSNGEEGRLLERPISGYLVRIGSRDEVIHDETQPSLSPGPDSNRDLQSNII
jgi:hypothetical protein